MKACLTSPGRFTAFDLGRELTRRGVLARMYTAYPMFKVDEELKARSSTRPWCTVAREMATRLRLRHIARRLQISTMLGLDRWVEPVRHCRTIGKAQMVRNDATPDIAVDPETYQVRVDGRPAVVDAVEDVAMSQLYYIV